jgi:hypothetical protein
MVLAAAILMHPRAAMEPFGWVVLAIILLNLLSPLFNRRRQRARAAPPASSTLQSSGTQTSTLQSSAGQAAPVQTSTLQSSAGPAAPVQTSTLQSSALQGAPPQSSPWQSPLQPASRSAAQQAMSLSDEDRAKLRQALAAGGLSALATELQRRQQATMSAQPVVVTQAPPSMPIPRPRYTTLAPQAIASTGPVAVVGPPLLTPVDLPTLPPPASTDGLTLMSLETSATSASLRFGTFNTPRALANAFVAAAIVGPCAALRPLGHTPAGW